MTQLEKHKQIWAKLQRLKAWQHDNYLTMTEKQKEKSFIIIKKTKKQLKKSFKKI